MCQRAYVDILSTGKIGEHYIYILYPMHQLIINPVILCIPCTLNPVILCIPCTLYSVTLCIPLSRSPNFPRAQYLDIRTLTHELIVKWGARNTEYNRV